MPITRQFLSAKDGRRGISHIVRVFEGGKDLVSLGELTICYDVVEGS
jgi:hypothetical protein